MKQNYHYFIFLLLAVCFGVTMWILHENGQITEWGKKSLSSATLGDIATLVFMHGMLTGLWRK